MTKAEVQRVDWHGLMRAGIQGLGLYPDQFWSLTPAELAMMLGVDPGSAPMTRAGLEALVRAWPDSKSIKEDGKDE